MDTARHIIYDTGYHDVKEYDMDIERKMKVERFSQDFSCFIRVTIILAELVLSFLKFIDLKHVCVWLTSRFMGSLEEWKMSGEI